MYHGMKMTEMFRNVLRPKTGLIMSKGGKKSKKERKSTMILNEFFYSYL